MALESTFVSTRQLGIAKGKKKRKGSVPMCMFIGAAAAMAAKPARARA